MPKQAARFGTARGTTPEVIDGRLPGLEASVKDALNGIEHPSWKVASVKVMRTNGEVVHGVVKVKAAGVYDHSLLDFQATFGPEGRVVAIEVNGRKVFLSRPKSRRSRS